MIGVLSRLRRRMLGAALPRRQSFKSSGLCPKFGLGQNGGAQPEPGAEPIHRSKLTARQSRASHPAAKPVVSVRQ